MMRGIPPLTSATSLQAWRENRSGVPPASCTLYVADDGSDVLERGTTVGRDDDGYGGRLPPQELYAVLERAKFIAGTGRPTLVNAMIGASMFREGSISSECGRASL